MRSTVENYLQEAVVRCILQHGGKGGRLVVNEAEERLKIGSKGSGRPRQAKSVGTKGYFKSSSTTFAPSLFDAAVDPFLRE